MSNPNDREQLLQHLNWRYATKQFDPAGKISPEDWAVLEQSLILSPSSFGLQPWKFIVVTHPELREKLKAASWGQSQVTDCSHHVVFAVRTQIDEAFVDANLQRITDIRKTPLESLNGLRQVILNFLPHVDPVEWGARQAYIALGTFMTSASALGIDTCPMEGLVPAQYDEILGLPAQGYKTVVACCAGYRAESDKYAKLPKVRFEPESLIEHR